MQNYNLQEIKEALNGRSVTWLCKEMEISPRSFYHKCKTSFTKSERYYMCSVLGVEFND